MKTGIRFSPGTTFWGTIVCLFAFAFSIHAQTAPLQEWHWRNPLPQGNRLLNVVAANGTFIALGELGTLLTSTDGTNWVRRECGTTLSLRNCAYGGGQYVVVGDFGTVLTSSNLDSWTPEYAGTFHSLNGITYANSQFLAVGEGATIVTSPDGVLWTTRASGDWPLSDVAFGSGTYVAVGGSPATANTAGIGVVLTSPDGVVWSLGTLISEPFYSVAYGGGVFATISATSYGDASGVWTSSDGRDWLPTATSPYYLSRIIYGQGKWIAGQGQPSNFSYFGTGATYASDDLENWSEVVSNSVGIAGIASAKGKFAAARQDGTFSISADGVTWTNTAPEPLTFYFRDLKYLNGSFVGVGNYSASFSPDGTVWTNAVALSNNLISITYGNGLYVAGGEYRTVWTSTDGVNWTNPAPDIGIYPYSSDVHVAFGNGTFVGAAGYSADILTSPDGLNWSVQQLTNGSYYIYFEDITFGNGRFVAVSPQIIATSADGTNWFVSTPTNAPSAVASGNGKFVAVGPDFIMTSTDGTNWTSQISSQFGPLSKVAFGGGFFVAVASQPYSQGLPVESPIWISSDGIHWTRSRSKTSRGLSNVTFGDGTFVIAGDNSLILQSDPIINLSLAITGVPQLLLSGPINRSYRIDCTSDLSTTNQWTPLTNITVSESPATFTDTTWTNCPARFYRAVLLQ
jgi:hypothetical protein